AASLDEDARGRLRRAAAEDEAQDVVEVDPPRRREQERELGVEADAPERVEAPVEDLLLLLRQHLDDLVRLLHAERDRRLRRARVPRSGTRMRAVVDTAQPLAVDVAVHLGRRQRRMTEQLLDRAQVGAALEQVRRERVPKPMRVRDEPPQRAGVEAPAAGGEEERALGAAREQWARVAQV